MYLTGLFDLICREEWKWIRNLDNNEVTGPPTAAQTRFHKDLMAACNQLLENLGINEDEAISHRLYDLEVVELSEDVSYILLLPPIEGVCSIPGHSEEMTEQPHYQTLPVQVFEMSECPYYRHYQSRNIPQNISCKLKNTYTDFSLNPLSRF